MKKSKERKKEIKIPIVILVILVVIIGLIVCRNIKTKDEELNQSNVTINDIEKIQARIDVLNQEIEQKQEKMEMALDQLNRLYEENVMLKNNE